MATWIPEKKISETTTEEVKLPWDVIADPPTIPSKTSQLTNDSGFTTNKGTVTQVKINGTTKSPNSAGLVDLGTGFAKTADLPIKSASLSGTTLYLTL